MKRLVFLSFVILVFSFVSTTLQVNDSPVVAAVEEVKVVPPAAAAPGKPGEVTPQSLLAELNQRRKEAGISPLQLDQRLNQSAQTKCDDMSANQYYDHIKPGTEVRGYELARQNMQNVNGSFGENLISPLHSAMTPGAIFDSWFKSEPHKKAALSAQNTLTGFGICTTTFKVPSSEYRTVVQHFYGS